MAGFRMHVGTSSVLGAGYAGTLHTMYGVPLPTATVAGALCGFSGMLPDLDSDNGVPLREAMGFSAATIPVILYNRFQSLHLGTDTIILVAIGLYLFVRFGLGGMVRKYTVHRGMFHSIPAMLIFGGIAFLLTGASPLNNRLMMSGGVRGGFLSHLILDEIYAVEYKGGRWRTKKSFGTALKLWGGCGWTNFSTYAKLAIVGMGIVGEPGVMQRFAPDQTQLADKVNQAINLVGSLGKDKPQFAKQVDDLRNLLGDLMNNPAQQPPPQNGSIWPTTPQNGASGWPTVAGAPQINQNFYAPPNSPAPNQNPAFAPSPYAPAQPPQSAVAPPPNDQPSNYPWPVANQSYNGDGQPGPSENQYDTAQRQTESFSQ